MAASAGQRGGGEVRHRGRRRLGEVPAIRGGAAEGHRQPHGPLVPPRAEKLLRLGGLPVGGHRP